ncbi:hypothetical protein SIM91_06470 [Rhodococcus opacus]|uniref:hypothetical protein n=1 Tax=Rhodococcus opacus TaxID=37919 RepID=UPI0002A29E04|nr:hypothetical protein [Rhodococcus opacus]ELB87338.1 hypothetical protein Rwratislav_40370 [Rhodococcus wratislaviensis IFP 2016]MDX5962956.1 hypothetical protein [Rhodococcus opacus]NKY69831.1 hypothetical protein [Rhodococcus opacus]CAG7599835.1 hypothetical protein E143388_04794 [Rhodococcus opacus]
MTSGAASGGVGTISYNTATTLTVTTVGATPATGDTFQIYQPMTIDGTHPSSIGHATIAAAFDLGLVK